MARLHAWLALLPALACSQTTPAPVSSPHQTDTPRVPELSPDDDQDMSTMRAAGRPPRPEPAQDYEWSEQLCRAMPDEARFVLDLPPEPTLRELFLSYTSVTCEVVVISREALDRKVAVSLGSDPITVKSYRVLVMPMLSAYGMTAVRRDGALIVVPLVDHRPGPEPIDDQRVVLDVRQGWVLTSEAMARERKAREAEAATKASPLEGMVECDKNRCQVDAAALQAHGGRPARARMIPRKAGGLKIYGVRRGSLFAAIGIVNGDTVIGWSGQMLPMDDQDPAVFEAAVNEAVEQRGTLRLDLESSEGVRRTLTVEFGPPRPL